MAVDCEDTREFTFYSSYSGTLSHSECFDHDRTSLKVVVAKNS